MTTQTRNEAAERLGESLAKADEMVRLQWLDEALAAERRATVERIQERVDRLAYSEDHDEEYLFAISEVDSILHEEAAL